MARRKKFAMLVVVSVPPHLTAFDARREVRTLISGQCNWRSDIEEDDVKPIKVQQCRTRSGTEDDAARALLSRTLDAWEGEEDSVQEEHANLIEEMRTFLGRPQ